MHVLTVRLPKDAMRTLGPATWGKATFTVVSLTQTTEILVK